MRKILFVLLIYITYNNCIAQQPSIQWQKSYGGSFYDKALSVVETIDGGYVIGGHSQSSNNDLSVNLGGFDCWIIKITNTGQLVWKISLGGTGEDYINSIIQTNDNGFMCIGYTNSYNGDIPYNYGHTDFWVVKLTSNGTVEWKKAIGGGSNEFAYSACQTGDGNYIIVGYSESYDQYVLNNHGMMDVWVLKINNSGTILWQKSYGGSKDDFGWAIIKVNTGGFIIAGYSYSDDYDLTTNKGEADCLVIKINDQGDIEWQSTFGGTLNDHSRAIIETSDGNFVIIGETFSYDLDASENHGNMGNRDYFVVKLNSQGQKVWSRCYGGIRNEYARSIVQNFAGEYVIVGESYTSDGEGDPVGNHGSADFWIIKVNPSNGDMLWQKSIGGSGHDEPNCLINTFDNGYLLVGNTASSNDGDIAGWHGDDDFCVLKLANTECQKNLVLTKDIPKGSYDFRAAENIIFKGKLLDPTSIIKLHAGKSVLLNNAFQTKSGGVFEIKIEGCNN